MTDESYAVEEIANSQIPLKDKIMLMAYSNLRKKHGSEGFLKQEMQTEISRITKINAQNMLNNITANARSTNQFQFKLHRLQPKPKCSWNGKFDNLPVFKHKDYIYIAEKSKEQLNGDTTEEKHKISHQLGAMLDFSKFKKQPKKTKVAEHATPTPAPAPEPIPQDIQGDIHLMAMTILEKLQPVLLNAIYTELMEHKK